MENTLRWLRRAVILFFLGCLCSPAALPKAAAIAPFPLRDVRLLDGPFKHGLEINRQYILALDPNRLLAPFYKEAGLPLKGEIYPDWEAGGLSGHIGGHYLTALAQMWAATGDTEMKRRLDYMIRELAACQKANGNGYVGGVPNSRALWTDIAAGKIDAQGFSLNGRWVPLYNMHKTWAGLRDAYRIGGNEQAKEILIRLTDWWLGVTSKLSDEQIQTMLRSEHGGLNEVFADVYAITGDTQYLSLALRFNHHQLLDALESHEDRLTGMHANTQIPKVIGFERIAQVSGAETLQDAARYFWERVIQARSVAFGGNSVAEHFNPTDDFQGMLEHRQGPETCNTYNMLRLSELLFYNTGDARYADYYERALFNHILSSQHPTHPGYVYFTPIRPCHYRVYSTPETNFWCCVGSGMESHGKYGQFIYAHDDENLYVNLFMASEVEWKARAITLRQETRFPDEARTRLTLSMATPTAFTLHIRYPNWVASGELTIHVNDAAHNVDVRPGSYVAIRRTWAPGDRIDVTLPMHTTTEPLPDGSDYVALMHGPICLAAKTGTDDLTGLQAGEGRWVHIPSGPLVPLNQAPMLVTADRAHLAAQVQSVPGKSMTFIAATLIRPTEFNSLELVPFYRVHDARYALYWRVATPKQYADVVEQLKAEEATKLALERNTLDLVTSGEQQPEMDHAFRGEETETGESEGRHWRESGAWFAYTLRSKPDVPAELRVTYTSDRRRRQFDVLVNDTVIATVDRMPRTRDPFIVETYTIEPDNLSKALEGRLTVTFRAQDNARTAQVCEVRLLRAATP